MSLTPTHGFGCAICSDTFRVNAQQNICTIPQCGHVYHEYCVKRWFRTQIQQGIPSSCPKCRTPATANQMVRLFLHQTISDDNDGTDEVDENEVVDENIICDWTTSDVDGPFDYFNDSSVEVGDEIIDDDFQQPPLPTQMPMNSSPMYEIDNNYENDLDDFAPFEWVAPSYPSLSDHANTLYALDQRLQSLRTDLVAMTDMVNGLESHIRTFH